MSGFIFNGVDSDEIGLEYAPDNGNTYVFREQDYTIHEQVFDGHDGGYFYGSTVKPKTFVLRCFYEDKKINEGIMAVIYSTFKRGTTGRLVFKKRPWIWYTATVTDVQTASMLNYMNGLVTITMKAYYPFGRCDDLYLTAQDNERMANSAMMIGSQWNDCGERATVQNPITSRLGFYVFNPGTERAGVTIEIAGNAGNGVTVENITTGQKVQIVGLQKAVTTNVGRWLSIDAVSGLCRLTNGQTESNGFLYHKSGFMELESAFPVSRNIAVKRASGSSTIMISSGTNKFNTGMVGKRIVLNSRGFGANIETVVDENTITISDPVHQDAFQETAVVMRANEIAVYGSGGYELTKLKLSFRPTFA